MRGYLLFPGQGLRKGTAIERPTVRDKLEEVTNVWQRDFSEEVVKERLWRSLWGHRKVRVRTSRRVDRGAKMGRGRGVDRSIKGGIRLLRGRGVQKIGDRVWDRSGGSLASSDHFRKGEVSSVISSHVNVRLVLSNRFHRNISRGGGGGSGRLGEGRWG